jgi:hypothetical protein
MSVVIRYAPISVTPDQYDEANRQFNERFGEDLPEGCDYHVAFIGPDGNVLVSEIWDSREQWEAFAAQLVPMLGELGIDPGTPQVFEVHHAQSR